MRKFCASRSARSSKLKLMFWNTTSYCVVQKDCSVVQSSTLLKIWMGPSMNGGSPRRQKFLLLWRGYQCSLFCVGGSSKGGSMNDWFWHFRVLLVIGNVPLLKLENFALRAPREVQSSNWSSEWPHSTVKGAAKIWIAPLEYEALRKPPPKHFSIIVKGFQCVFFYVGGSGKGGSTNKCFLSFSSTSRH